MSDLKQMIVGDDKNLGDFGHDSEESQCDYERQIADRVSAYLGDAREVPGGWVWVIGENEQRWSKRSTRHQCERVVYEVVETIGMADAFDLAASDGDDDAEVQS